MKSLCNKADSRLKDAGSIITIGFERDRAYLANAPN